MSHKVTVFRPYPFKAGQKIRIDGGGRSGDWLVVGVTERDVTLRCPLSEKEFTWPIFCFDAREYRDEPWPRKD